MGPEEVAIFQLQKLNHANERVSMSIGLAGLLTALPFTVISVLIIYLFCLSPQPPFSLTHTHTTQINNTTIPAIAMDELKLLPHYIPGSAFRNKQKPK